MINQFADLPVFVTVVDCGSFSQAAKQLNLTKSAVSKRISHLEDGLGIRLLNRTTRKLSLTEAGQRYYDYASQALSLAKRGVDAVSELHGSPQGRLKITAPMTFGVLHVAPLISEFLGRYPEVEIDLQLEDKMVDLVEGGFDLGIRIGHLPDSNLIAKRLAPCRTVLCASPSYVEKMGAPQKPADLADHNCLRYSYFRGGNEWLFLHQEQEFKVLPRGNFIVNNSEAIRRALIAGIGVAQMPTFIIGKELRSGTLVNLMPEYRLPEHFLYAVYPQRKHMPLKVRMFIDFLSEKLGSDTPYWD
ncbi:LysR family transcriptional regulator [Vibrio cidicii]|jgi:DNA-binding transcriptional LysR family regulator|uniref:LysR family transcriptional regulator n=1 Tax=Vibrio cidicii TaxID=1763883 RepID=A0ABR5W6T7_9VIBR|nr:LysR family transcriptional regulator [Vibrio cidicii]EJN6826832.1 LysR family transcriptional regulator [Vibrio cidicii]ELV8624273.1 LysR family transcriptional regulator [Vibrio cidicii]KYN90924.1 LysR family transcriptional regulator [Vibrio cidicii]MBG0753779.1 LysR family transcriptional regulator [Vibrio cidicii]MBG0759937.1 LysR family transcriptional regulator [Vibrio cidicii]